jgi:hypothetical protein
MDFLGYLQNNSNTVGASRQGVCITSSEFSDLHGVFMTPDNFLKSTIVFTIRALIMGKYSTWVNDKDNYMIPNIVLKDKEI